MSDSTWKTRAEEDMGVRLTQWQTLSGGDFAQSYAASVSAVDSRASNLPHFTIGQRIFIKTHANPPPEHFTTGSLSVPNSPSFTWADFYATQRLLPLARIASDRQALSASTVGDIERVAQRLSEWVDDEISASLLHGDLWAGNRLVDINQQSWVIDPACHGGHREFDLQAANLLL